MTKALPPVRPETFAAQAGGNVESETRAIISPIHIATTYVRDPDNGYSSGYVYGRPDNLTVRQAEAVITNLENGVETLLTGSGMTAATTAILALERPAHVIAPEIMYWALKLWLKEDAKTFGIDVTFVPGDDVAAFKAAVRPGQTRMIWIETPANPTWTISDIRAISKVAHDAGALLAVDSTIATPVHCQPLSLGADVVMHAATKYLNGHSDVVAGSLTFARKDEYFDRAARMRKMLGGILGPFEAAMLMRGMRTLHVRVRQQSANAMALAEHFARDPRVVEVLYPGLQTNKGHTVARQQMSGGFSGMVSIRVAGGEARAIRTAANVKVWKRATSLGGVESLIEHRASIEGPGTLCPNDLLRLSIGVENVQDLIADLDQALGTNA
ncbi:MAG TPA: aminotransferase class I/II-fold pyridoxal phosphate-dependent enzyme [Hyphomicrobiaceae bacterium]|nr:aminotransferase class I/II-fold pyridoxal phosphate-dependent enzyme [Hyphomicrobiaceae bacterium]